MSTPKAGALVLGCLAIFAISCHFLIHFTLQLGGTLGISPVLLSLLVLAIGTSIPDTMASIAAVKKGMGSLAVSNAVGSNIFDVWFCIGLPLAFRENTQIQGEVGASIPFLMASFLVTLGVIRTGWFVSKREGYLLLFIYSGICRLFNLYCVFEKTSGIQQNGISSLKPIISGYSSKVRCSGRMSQSP